MKITNLKPENTQIERHMPALALGLIFVLLGAFAMTAYDTMVGLESTAATSLRTQQQEFQALGEFTGIVHARARTVREILATTRPAIKRRLATRMNALTSSSGLTTRSLLESIETLSGSTHRTIVELESSVVRAGNAAIDHSINHDPATAQSILHRKLAPLELRLDKQLHMLRATIANNKEIAAANIHQQRLAGMWFMAGLFIAIVATGGIAGWGAWQRQTRWHTRFERVASLPDHCPAAILTLDETGTIRYANAAAMAIINEFDVNSRELERLLPTNTSQIVASLLDTGHEWPAVEKTVGSHTWLISFEPVANQKLVHCYYTDVSSFRKIEEQLDREKEHAEVTLSSIGDGVITTDAHGNIDFMNPVAEKLTGTLLCDAQDKPLGDIYQRIDEDTNAAVSDPAYDCLRGSDSNDQPSSHVLVRADGNEIAIEDTTTTIRNHDGEVIGVVVVFHDVSETRQMAHHLSWQANHDPLTGLINRTAFENRLDQALRICHQENLHHSLMFIDLDQFKIVNDTCGHMAGDRLLSSLTQLLQQRMRGSDMLARIGGDEFGVLLENCALEEALPIAEDLRKIVTNYRFTWKGRVFSVGASIGLVGLSSETPDLASAMSAADLACYAAKDLGRNRVHIYRHEDDELAARQGQMNWVARIRSGLQDGSFRLYEQLITNIRQPDALPAYEILIRLSTQEGLISPGAFLPAAERYGLMTEIDRWVIENTLLHLAGAGSAMDHIDFYSINLSGSSLSDNNMLAFIMEQFDYTNVPAYKICFEITETVAVASLSKAERFISRLRQRGCRFALDDFGSGMSSFTYLKHLPVDFVKIEGSFVQDIVDDPVDFTMVKSINEVAHAMGMQTIAEFVEDAQTLDLLRQLNIDFAQGYVIHKPSVFKRPRVPDNQNVAS